MNPFTLLSSSPSNESDSDSGRETDLLEIKDVATGDNSGPESVISSSSEASDDSSAVDAGISSVSERDEVPVLNSDESVDKSSPDQNPPRYDDGQAVVGGMKPESDQCGGGDTPQVENYGASDVPTPDSTPISDTEYRHNAGLEGRELIAGSASRTSTETPGEVAPEEVNAGTINGNPGQSDNETDRSSMCDEDSTVEADEDSSFGLDFASKVQLSPLSSATRRKTSGTAAEQCERKSIDSSSGLELESPVNNESDEFDETKAFFENDSLEKFPLSPIDIEFEQNLPFRSYRFIKTVAQEWHDSFNLKQFVPRSEVVKFCSNIFENSVAENGSQINFQQLNAKNLAIRGIFGHKDEICILLSALLSIDEKYHGSLKKYLYNNFTEGLTGFQKENSDLFLFYWPSDDFGSKIDIENRAVVFLRYLIDLSGEVITMIDSDEVELLKQDREVENTITDLKLVTIQDTKFEFSAKQGLPISLSSLYYSSFITFEGSIAGFCSSKFRPSQIITGSLKTSFQPNRHAVIGFLQEKATKFKLVFADGMTNPSLESFVKFVFPDRFRWFEDKKRALEKEFEAFGIEEKTKSHREHREMFLREICLRDQNGILKFCSDFPNLKYLATFFTEFESSGGSRPVSSVDSELPQEQPSARVSSSFESQCGCGTPNRDLDSSTNEHHFGSANIDKRSECKQYDDDRGVNDLPCSSTCFGVTKERGEAPNISEATAASSFVGTSFGDIIRDAFENLPTPSFLKENHVILYAEPGQNNETKESLRRNIAVEPNHRSSRSAAAGFKCGSPCDVQWGSTWYGAEILHIDGDKQRIRIHYIGHPDHFDEWMQIDSSRLSEAQTHCLTPGAHWDTGSTLDVRDRYRDKWRPARVLCKLYQRSGLRIHYFGHSSWYDSNEDILFSSDRFAFRGTRCETVASSLPSTVLDLYHSNVLAKTIFPKRSDDEIIEELQKWKDKSYSDFYEDSYASYPVFDKFRRSRPTKANLDKRISKTLSRLQKNPDDSLVTSYFVPVADSLIESSIEEHYRSSRGASYWHDRFITSLRVELNRTMDDMWKQLRQVVSTDMENFLEAADSKSDEELLDLKIESVLCQPRELQIKFREEVRTQDRTELDFFRLRIDSDRKQSLRTAQIFFPLPVGKLEISGAIRKVFSLDREKLSLHSDHVIVVFEVDGVTHICVSGSKHDRHIHSLGTRFDLVALDELSRRLFLYSASRNTLDCFQLSAGHACEIAAIIKVVALHMDLSFSVKAMHVLSTAKQSARRLCVISSDSKALLFDIETGVLDARFDLQEDFVHSLVSPDGIFLMLFSVVSNNVVIRVFVVSGMKHGIEASLGDCILSTELKIFRPNMIDSIQVFNNRSFIQLAAIDPISKQIKTYVCDTKTATTRSKFEQTHVEDDSSSKIISTKIDYFGLAMNKFAIDTPSNPKGLCFESRFVLSDALAEQLSEQKRFRGLDAETNRFTKLITERVRDETRKSEIEWISTGCVLKDLYISSEPSKIGAGNFIRTLICAVPIQIARAENGQFLLMNDGLDDYEHFESRLTLMDLYGGIHFGLLDALFNEHTGPVKVVSSMGPQNSGKSYTLNHLKGTYFAQSGQACTDGIWLSIRIDRVKETDVMYVFLDVEGLGSLNSPEADTLIAVFVAAISNLTVFKSEKVIAASTRATFNRFQIGVGKISGDPQLFNGSLCMIINNVLPNDRKSVKAGFENTMAHIMENTPEEKNFLAKMYQGSYQVSTLDPINTRGFFSGFRLIDDLLEDKEIKFHSGASFCDRIKLLMAKMHLNDYQPLSVQLIKFRVQLLEKFLDTAVETSQMSASIGDSTTLICFDTNEPIPEVSLERISEVFESKIQPDSKIPLDLSRKVAETTIDSDFSLVDTRDNHLALFTKLHSICERTQQNMDEYSALFRQYLEVVITRRELLIQKWVDVNTVNFNRDVPEFDALSEAIKEKFLAIRKKFAPCDMKCTRCNFYCLLPPQHHDQDPVAHDCLLGSLGDNVDHNCESLCSHCEVNLNRLCRLKAGHADNHDCIEMKHLCSFECELKDYQKCDIRCSGKVDHESLEHLCKAVHLCKENCSAPSCNQLCKVRYDSDEYKNGEHTHDCGNPECCDDCETFTRNRCGRPCKQGHFHSGKHLCSTDHLCPNDCQKRGTCSYTVLARQKEVNYHSRSGVVIPHTPFKQCHAARNLCNLRIPPGEDSHDGPCECAVVMHTCDNKCDLCGYFCHEAVGHKEQGIVCRTEHGNMRDGKIVSEEESAEIDGITLVSGEGTTVIESCQTFCQSRGRGHLHIISCQNTDPRLCPQEFKKRHGTSARIAREHARPYDTVTHEEYFRLSKWQDPVDLQDVKASFTLCRHYCAHPSHQNGSFQYKDSRDLDEEESKGKFYCVREVLHNPVKALSAAGCSVSLDGHEYKCEHQGPLHLIFCLDMSSSMNSADFKPQLLFQNSRNLLANNLGCVYEKLINFLRQRVAQSIDEKMSVIVFNHQANLIVDRKPLFVLDESLLKNYPPSGGTSFYAALEMAKATIHSDEATAIIFLSDGEDFGNVLDLIDTLKEKTADFQIHTVFFGPNGGGELLRKMKDKTGKGTFQTCDGDIALEKHFSTLVKSLASTLVAVVPAVAADLVPMAPN
uniref:VWFA domain-containing protein n=1 Tax=Hirondellea gigas TaxID=1518452 RepID=A0A6A7FZI6_9CRUS